MITFNNTGISNTPTKSGRSLVYTDILSGITYTGITLDQLYSGIVTGVTSLIIISGITYTGTTSGSTYNILVSGHTYTGITSGSTFNLIIAGGKQYIANTNLIYHWTIYVPTLSGQTLSQYLTTNASIYEADIVTKEALWKISPHTRQITDELGHIITVDIPKEEIVCATIPDYIETVSDINLDIPAIKRLLQTLMSNLVSSTGITNQQIKDLATIYDYWEVGHAYKIGESSDYKGTPYKCIQAHTSQSDWTPNVTPSLWVVIGTSPNWTAGVAYKVNDIVKYIPNGFNYKCLQAHTAQVGWEPPNVPALWQKQ